MFRKIVLSLGFVLFLGLLSSCGPDGSLRLEKYESEAKNTESKTEKNPEKPGENTSPAAAPPSEIGAPVALPPTYAGEPPKPGETNTQFMPNGLPALQPLGVNADQLFAEKLKDTQDRFDRLENAVVEMRKEFDSIKPSIIRLAAVESDIQGLIKELDVMLQETPTGQETGYDDESATAATLQVEQLDPQPLTPDLAQPPAQSAEAVLAEPPASIKIEDALASEQSQGPPPAGVPPPPPVAAAAPTPSTTPVPAQEAHTLKLPEGYVPSSPAAAEKATAPSPASAAAPPKPAEAPKPMAKESVAPAPKSQGTEAMNLRVGEHTDKVRIVLDTNKKTPFSIDLDNDEKLIVVELPEARWPGPTEQKFQDSQLLESYSVEPTNGGKGSMIILTLKRTTQIIKQGTLDPDGQNSHHRIYFDLKP